MSALVPEQFLRIEENPHYNGLSVQEAHKQSEGIVYLRTSGSMGTSKIVGVHSPRRLSLSKPEFPCGRLRGVNGYKSEDQYIGIWTMKIIGAGLGRTGTSSLKVAFEMLGFGPCYHMQELNKHPEHIPTWLDAVDGKLADWRALLRSYQSTLDWPACEYYAELMTAFPEAKVLLTVRDPERWYESTHETIYMYNNSFPDWARAVAPKAAQQVELRQRQVWEGKFGGRFEERAYAIEVFERHNQAVQQTVPADRLLVYEVGQGWESLCRFLQVPIPTDEPFPHVNDKAEFQRMSKWLHAKKNRSPK